MVVEQATGNSLLGGQQPVLVLAAAAVCALGDGEATTCPVGPEAAPSHEAPPAVERLQPWELGTVYVVPDHPSRGKCVGRMTRDSHPLAATPALSCAWVGTAADLIVHLTVDILQGMTEPACLGRSQLACRPAAGCTRWSRFEYASSESSRSLIH